MVFAVRVRAHRSHDGFRRERFLAKSSWKNIGFSDPNPRPVVHFVIQLTKVPYSFVHFSIFRVKHKYILGYESSTKMRLLHYWNTWSCRQTSITHIWSTDTYNTILLHAFVFNAKRLSTTQMFLRKEIRHERLFPPRRGLSAACVHVHRISDGRPDTFY